MTSRSIYKFENHWSSELFSTSKFNKVSTWQIHLTIFFAPSNLSYPSKKTLGQSSSTPVGPQWPCLVASLSLKQPNSVPLSGLQLLCLQAPRSFFLDCYIVFLFALPAPLNEAGGLFQNSKSDPVSPCWESFHAPHCLQNWIQSLPMKCKILLMQTLPTCPATPSFCTKPQPLASLPMSLNADLPPFARNSLSLFHCLDTSSLPLTSWLKSPPPHWAVFSSGPLPHSSYSSSRALWHLLPVTSVCWFIFPVSPASHLRVRIVNLTSECQLLERTLAARRHSINGCWINKWTRHSCCYLWILKNGLKFLLRDSWFHCLLPDLC